MPGVLRTEVRHSPMLAAVPVLAFLGGLAAWRGLIPGVATWESTSLALLGATQLVGPVAAGLACWIAQRERRRQLAYLRVLSAHRAPAVPMLQLGAAVLWAVVAHLSVCGALALHTLVHGGIGRPGPGVVAVGCLGVAVHVTVGFLVGAAVPWRAAAPLVALACYVAVVLTMDHAGQWFSLLSPVTVETASVFVAWQRGIFAAQGWWLLAVLAVLTALVSMTGRMTRTALVAGAAGLLAAVLGAQQVKVYQGHLFSADLVEPVRVCEGSAPVVCLHPAFRRAAGTVRQEFAPLVRRLDGTPARTRVLQHRAAWDRSPLPPGVAALYLDDLAPGYAVRAREYLVQDLTGGDECRRRENLDGRLYAGVVSAWLLDLRSSVPPGYAAAGDRFRRATETQRHAWFVAHFAAYRSCALTAASFTGVP